MTTKSEKPVELEGLSVTVDRVVYSPDADTPPDRPHCFAYFITIRNESSRNVTIKGRKWVVTENTGEVIAVEGTGVVGQYPQIPPGGSFSYHSYHLLASEAAVAEGSYLAVDDDGRLVIVRIPRFEMRVAE
jgi:ApaG protein